MDRKEKTILVTIVANIVLIVLRFFLARISGSIGLMANAWHSFTDVFVTSVVFTGLLISRFGGKRLGAVSKKAEHILAIFVSFFIFYMGVEILGDALSGEKTELRYVPFVAAGVFFGVLINYFMARYKIYVGQQTGSQSLIADGYHSKMDMYCSIAVLFGIIGSLFGMPDLDKIAAIVAMVLMVSAGWEILTSNLHMLLHPDEEVHGHTHGHSFHADGRMLLGIGGVLLCAYFLSGIYIVQADETGVVRRFGRVVNGNVAPGIHYRLPTPFENVTLVRSESVRTTQTGVQELLTGDTNLVNVNLSVHYKIENAEKYVLNVKNADQLVDSGAATSIRKIIGESAIDTVLTDGKEQIERRALELLKETMQRNQTGIQVLSVQIIQADPPQSVMASFRDLATARQDKSIYINEAVAYQNMLLPQANADAYKIVSEAEGYRSEKIAAAQADADLFASKQQAYQDYSAVTRFRLYMETMDTILPNAQKLLLGDGIQVDSNQLWITQSK